MSTTTIRFSLTSRTEGGDPVVEREGWYQRTDNNGWRPVRIMLTKIPDE